MSAWLPPRAPTHADLEHLEVLGDVFAAPRSKTQGAGVGQSNATSDEDADFVAEADRHDVHSLSCTLDDLATRRVPPQLHTQSGCESKQAQVERADGARWLHSDRHATIKTLDGHDVVYIVRGAAREQPRADRDPTSKLPDSPTAVGAAMQEFSRTYGLGETKESARHSSKPPHSTPHVDVGYWTFWHDRVFRKEEDPMYGSTELRKALRSADSLTSATALLHTLGYFMVAAWSLLVRLQPRAAKILLESTLSRAHIDPVRSLANCPFWVWSGVALLRNAEVDPHFDSNDARYGWIAETVAGDFSGGEMFLPQLGIVVPVRPGDVLLMRSGLLEHCVLPCTGERCAVVAFRHESTMVHASMGRTAEVLKQSKTWESPPDDSPAYHKLVTELRGQLSVDSWMKTRRAAAKLNAVVGTE